jgi:pimeloyl-ACP methyl ester carboxylesterase
MLAQTAAQPVRAVAWREVATTYVICEEDKVLPVALQEHFAQRAGQTRRIASGHSPFLSRPGEVAEILRRAAQEGLDTR